MRFSPPLVALAALAAACHSSSPGEHCPPAETIDAAPAAGTPDAGPAGDDGRFTLVVIPDTQYLFDGDRGNADVLEATLRWIVDHGADQHIVFTAGLGDIVENHAPEELAAASDAYQILDDHHIHYSVLAGNHDLPNSNQYDDARSGGAQPYLDAFAPTRIAGQPTYGGASPTGYNTYSIFDGGGKKWLLLALDWRPSMASLAWAKDVIHAHPDLPVIVTTHELVYDGGDGVAQLSGNGQYVWDNLINDNDQIFLTVNGHFWPPARGVRANKAGHDVHMHIANYQDRYYGGSGMIRLYRFDLARGTIEASTFSPYWQATPTAQRSPLAQGEVELDGDRDRFVDNVDFAARFHDFEVGVPPAPPGLPADKVVIDGTVAYWRFNGGTVGAAVPAAGVAVADLSKHGNDLTRVTLAGGAADSMKYAAEYHPAQPAHGSLFLNGSKRDPAFGGAYLRTADGAPLNAMTFEHGYTIEAFVRFPADFSGDRNAWMGVVGRVDTGADAKKTGDDPLEPAGTLSVSDGHAMQWAIYPTSSENTFTSWSHELPLDRWHHVAVVNDGHHSVMYVDGSPVTRNPHTESIGIATGGSYWLVGAYAYNHVIEQSFYGWLGDVRIVDHALTPDHFMTAR
jgi:Concanavalin A-like lectin/glucanases superfamily